VGVGINNYPLVRREHYRIALYDWIASVPHSTYIQAISELGIAGTVPLLLLWFQFFRLNARTRRAILSQGPGARRTFEFGLATALDLSMVGYMATGAFVAVLWYPHLFLLFGLSSALHSVCAHQQAHAIRLTNRAENQPQLAW
jgi:O-antigen ligase